MNYLALFALNLASPALKYHEVYGPWGRPRGSEKDRLKLVYVSEGTTLKFGKLEDKNHELSMITVLRECVVVECSWYIFCITALHPYLLTYSMVQSPS